jgi:hypothetical protein
MEDERSYLSCALDKVIRHKRYIYISALALVAICIAGFGCSPKKEKRPKMILSFYLDDTNPATADPGAYKTFLEYCRSHGIKGESSVILGYDGRSLADNPEEDEIAFLQLARNSYDYGMDVHMEIMTHKGLYDFKEQLIPEGVIHEGLWLHEPGVSGKEYMQYFSSILGHGDSLGIKFSGLTWPGCGCEACTHRYGELREMGPLKFNQAVWEALIELVKQDRFNGRVIPIFYESSEEEYGIIRKAADGDYAVYDLMPNAEDQMGIWENTADKVDPDYYISEDGKSGIIIKHLQDGAPYCMWYMHWQGLNPGNGLGWEAFQKVVERIEMHLSDQVVWMRPSDMVTRYHERGSWDFVNDL